MTKPRVITEDNEIVLKLNNKKFIGVEGYNKYQNVCKENGKRLHLTHDIICYKEMFKSREHYLEIVEFFNTTILEDNEALDLFLNKLNNKEG